MTTEMITFLGEERPHLSELTPEGKICFPIIYDYYVKRPTEIIELFRFELVELLKPVFEKEKMDLKPHFILRASNALADEGLITLVRKEDVFVGYRLASAEDSVPEKNEIEFDDLTDEKKNEFAELVNEYQNSLKSIKQFVQSNKLDFDQTWETIINKR